MFRIAVKDQDDVVCQWRSTFESVQDALDKVPDAEAEFPDSTVIVEQLVKADDGESAAWEGVE